MFCYSVKCVEHMGIFLVLTYFLLKWLKIHLNFASQGTNYSYGFPSNSP